MFYSKFSHPLRLESTVSSRNFLHSAYPLSWTISALKVDELKRLDFLFHWAINDESLFELQLNSVWPTILINLGFFNSSSPLEKNKEDAVALLTGRNRRIGY